MATTKRTSTSKKADRTATTPAGGKKSSARKNAASRKTGTKGDAVVALLKKPTGATISEMTNTTGWQPHSVRGFLSGALKKKQGLTIKSEKGEDGQRRYRIAS